MINFPSILSVVSMMDDGRMIKVESSFSEFSTFTQWYWPVENRAELFTQRSVSLLTYPSPRLQALEQHTEKKYPTIVLIPQLAIGTNIDWLKCNKSDDVKLTYIYS